VRQDSSNEVLAESTSTLDAPGSVGVREESEKVAADEVDEEDGSESDDSSEVSENEIEDSGSDVTFEDFEDVYVDSDPASSSMLELKVPRLVAGEKYVVRMSLVREKEEEAVDEPVEELLVLQ